MWQNTEGIPHFANKSVARKWLENRLRQGRAAYLFYDHEDGPGMVNLLDGVSEVIEEGEFGWADHAPYRADVLLRRANEPPSALEIVHTHPPEYRKLSEAARLGIDLYEIEGGHPPFSEKGLKVLATHIAPANRRPHRDFNSRMIDLYDRIANPSSLDDGFIRVVKNWRGSLDQHDHAKRDEMEETEKKFARLRSEIRQQHVFCARCKKPNELIDGDKGFRYSSILAHRPNGGCGRIHLCQGCEFEIRGGWHGVFPSDAVEWWPRDDCPDCRDVDQAHEDERDRRFAPGPTGYIVEGRTVSREEFLGLLTLLDWTAVIASEYLDWAGAGEQRLREFQYITRDSIAQLIETVYSGTDAPNDADLRPAGIFGGTLPPCPLTLGEAAAIGSNP